MYQMNAIEHSFMISNDNRQDNTTLFSDTVWHQHKPQAVEITTQQHPRLDGVTVQQQQLQVDEVTMQQQPEMDENTARQHQLRYDNDGVLEIYNMLQDVECPEKPNVDETDDTQKKAMGDPAQYKRMENVEKPI